MTDGGSYTQSAAPYLFNLGNVMFCAVTKALLPHVDVLRTAFGVASGAVFLTVAGRYLQFVDDSVSSTT